MNHISNNLVEFCLLKMLEANSDCFTYRHLDAEICFFHVPMRRCLKNSKHDMLLRSVLVAHCIMEYGIFASLLKNGMRCTVAASSSNMNDC